MFLFNSAGLREATDPYDFRRVLKALDDAGPFFETGTAGEKAKRRRTPDGQDPKLYHIDPGRLDS